MATVKAARRRHLIRPDPEYASINPSTAVSKGFSMLRDPEGIERKLLNKIFRPSAGQLPDVAWGNDHLTTELGDIPDFITAIDPDPVSIKKARPLIERGVSLNMAHGLGLPFADNRFGTVVFSMSLHQREDPGKCSAGKVGWRIE